MALPPSTRRRLDALVNRELLNTDAQYKAMSESFRAWLTLTEHALHDEGINDEVSERVLNRVVYGHPSGAEAYERIDARAQIQQMLERPHAPTCSLRAGGTECTCQPPTRTEE